MLRKAGIIGGLMLALSFFAVPTGAFADPISQWIGTAGDVVEKAEGTLTGDTDRIEDSFFDGIALIIETLTSR